MEAPKPKRQKVSLACTPCRNRKVKCSGREPVCEPCSKRAGGGALCTWDTGSNPISAQISAHQVQWLDNRIRLLEHSDMHGHTSCPNGSLTLNGGFGSSMPQIAGIRRSSRPGSLEPNAQPRTTSFPCFEYPSTAPSRAGKYNQQIESITTVAQGANAPRREPSRRMEEVSPSDVSSVHAIIGPALDEDNQEGYFGSSSAGTFMQMVKKMVQRKHGEAQQPVRPVCGGDDDDLPLLIPRPQFRQKQVDYVLPSRKTADSLMSSYWKYVHILYPFLDRAHTQDDYEKLWRGDSSISDERSFICLLNIIFALSSQLSGSMELEKREGSASVFYLRARDLLEVVESASVRLVQSYLLLGQYFQSTNETHPSWMFVGFGIRTAQSLGLHLPKTSERVSDIRTRELLRKVWHGCILMDRTLSMTYGRPCMIGPKTASGVPLPLAIDEEHLQPRSIHQFDVRAQKQSITDFYIYSLRLYEILHLVLFNYYSTDVQPSQPIDRLHDRYFGRSSSLEGQSSVFEIEHRLSMWEKSVPDHLKLGGLERSQDSEMEAVLHRQAVILHQRHLHVRLLLLRHMLTNSITSTFQGKEQSTLFGGLFFRRISLQCAISCVQVAQEAIDTIHREKPTCTGDVGYLSPWWYNVLFLYTAATVLIAARLDPLVLAEVSEESILDRWHKALGILEGYGVFGISIRRLTTTLRLLFDAVPQQFSQRRQNARQLDAAEARNTYDEVQVTVPLADWRLTNPIGTPPSSLPPSLRETAPGSTFENINSFEGHNPSFPEAWSEFDSCFDLQDYSWLTTIPFES